ncbi:hypothetical protein YGAWVPHU_CDS0052 [Salmonella phage SeKF_13]|uniref:Uncharacterized protein n=2 Tax=Caudoviricetes TaxID=2731619 RepID=A0AAU8EJE2_9CAUD
MNGCLLSKAHLDEIYKPKFLLYSVPSFTV